MTDIKNQKNLYEASGISKLDIYFIAVTLFYIIWKIIILLKRSS